MFSVRQKREIAAAVQKILRATNHPELPPPEFEIRFLLHVDGAHPMSWADIRNNENVKEPDVNPWNEAQDAVTSVPDGSPALNASGVSTPKTSVVGAQQKGEG